MEEERLTEPIIHPPAPTFPDVAGKSLNEVLDGKEDTFQQRLFKLIDERGLDDAREAMGWALRSGIINGIDGAIEPRGDATRAQVAAIMTRFVRYIASAAA